MSAIAAGIILGAMALGAILDRPLVAIANQLHRIADGIEEANR